MEAARGPLKTPIAHLRALAASALGRMYRPDERLYAFRVHRTPAGDVLEGVSRRYTAMVLLALAEEEGSIVEESLPGARPQDVCAALLAEVDRWDNLGDVAVGLWAARALEATGADRALKRLHALDPVDGGHPTVEIAWALSALSIERGRPRDDGLAERVAHRLRSCYRPESGMFTHHPPHFGNGARSHVSCFADLVYPVQALALFGTATGARWALDAARGGAEQMVRTQGPAGQWWWHFDARTGAVIEKYPVYAVHQDGMAPMALFDAGAACRADYGAAADKGMQWLTASPELNGGSLIDLDAGVIWRKVCRREPGKLARWLNAAASGMHPALRCPGLDALMPPKRVDWESRPYHMGWLLYAWRRRECAAREGAAATADLHAEALERSGA